MTYTRLDSSSVIEVPDYQSLLEAWRVYGLVGRYIVREPLTEAQLRRLPLTLLERLECLDDSLAFLERLYALEDPRD